MRIRTFGHIDIERDGQMLELASRPRLLLAMLASRYGQAVSDDALIEGIWPNRQPSSARQALQGYILTLRDAADPDRQRRQPGSVIRRDGDGYRLDVDAKVLDLARVEQLGDRPMPRSDADLDELLDITGAAPFGEFSSEVWAEAHSASLGELRRRAFVERFEIELELGTAETQLGRLKGAAAEFPYDEHVAALLMIALYRNRRQADALAVFDSIRRRLVADVGISPGAALSTVHDDVLQHAATLDLPNRPSTLRVELAPSTPSDLLDRRHDLAQITDSVLGNRLVTVHGPGGVGKTVVLADVVRVVESKFAVIVRLDASAVPPTDVVDEFGRVIGVDPHPLVDISTSVLEVFGDRSVLLVVDTCEAALEQVRVIVDLALKAPNVHVLLGSRMPINHRRERRQRLGPLSRSGAVELFRRAGLDDVDIHVESLDALVERLDGLPLALEMVAHRVVALGAAAVIADLDQSRGSVQFDSEAGGLPDRHRSLDALVGWSLRSLDAGQLALAVRCAAVSGSFPIEALTALDPLDEVARDQVAVVLPQLVEASLVVRIGDAPALFRVPDTVADAIDRLAPSVALGQRTLVANHIVALSWADYTGAGPSTVGTWVGDRQARAIDHLMATPDARVVMLATAAARSWLDAGALDQGRRVLGSALGAVPDLPPALASISWAILGFNQLYQGDIRQSLESYRTSLESVDAVALEGMRELISSTVLWLECDFDASWSVASSGVEAMTTASRRAPANLVAFAKYALFAGELDGADDCYERAIRLARSGSDVVAEANAVRLAAVVAALRGDHDRASQSARRSVALHDASASTLGAAQAASTMALVAALAGDEATAQSWIDRALERALRQFDVMTAMVTLPIVSWFDVNSGRAERSAHLLGWVDHFLADQRHVRHPTVATFHRDIDAMLAQVDEHDRRRWMAEGAAMSAAEVLRLSASD